LSKIPNVQNLNTHQVKLEEKILSNDKRDPRLLEASRMFEHEFLRQMVKEMRDTVPEDELMPDGVGGKIFKEELDKKYVENWVDGGGVGLADLIYDQVQERMDAIQNRGVRATQPGEVLPLPKNQQHSTSVIRPPSAVSVSKPQDILLPEDAGLFVARATPSLDKDTVGMTVDLQSKAPLGETVALRSPFEGRVIQAGVLEDGRQAVVVEHSVNGSRAVTTFVHSGHNKVRPGQTIFQGAPLAEFPVAIKGELAKAQFTMKIVKAQE